MSLPAIETDVVIAASEYALAPASWVHPRILILQARLTHQPQDGTRWLAELAVAKAYCRHPAVLYTGSAGYCTHCQLYDGFFPKDHPLHSPKG